MIDKTIKKVRKLFFKKTNPPPGELPSLFTIFSIIEKNRHMALCSGKDK